MAGRTYLLLCMCTRWCYQNKYWRDKQYHNEKCLLIIHGKCSKSLCFLTNKRLTSTEFYMYWFSSIGSPFHFAGTASACHMVSYLQPPPTTHTHTNTTWLCNNHKPLCIIFLVYRSSSSVFYQWACGDNENV